MTKYTFSSKIKDSYLFSWFKKFESKHFNFVFANAFKSSLTLILKVSYLRKNWCVRFKFSSVAF